jgi:hypothetical protein
MRSPANVPAGMYWRPATEVNGRVTNTLAPPGGNTPPPAAPSGTSSSALPKLVLIWRRPKPVPGSMRTGEKVSPETAAGTPSGARSKADSAPVTPPARSPSWFVLKYA